MNPRILQWIDAIEREIMKYRKVNPNEFITSCLRVFQSIYGGEMIILEHCEFLPNQ